MPAASKQMRFWVDVALESVRRDHTPSFGSGDQRGPFLTARALGMALGALHDGYALASGRTQLLPFSVAAPALPVDPNITGAAACHELLLHRYPAQSAALNMAWDFWVRLFNISLPLMSSSETYGRMIGDAVHLLGISDRQVGRAMTYSPYGAYTHDRPPNEPKQRFAGSVWGSAKRLVTSQLVADFAPPPGRTGPTTVIPNAHFAADFQKVQTKGASDDRTRTGDEEVVGIYWGYDGPSELGTPPRLYLQVVLAVLDEIEARNPGGLQEQEELQIIAATGLAMADAGIDAWYYKYSIDHMMWRPVLGIPNGLGALAAPEPGWLPLGRPDTNGSGVNLTPDFPAYPSGHATLERRRSSCCGLFWCIKAWQASRPMVSTILRSALSQMSSTDAIATPRPPQAPRPKLPRKYPNLWEAITENSISRVFLGVHWQFDGVTIKGTDANGEFGIPATPQELGRRGGVWLGCQIANEVAAKIGIPCETIAASLPQ